MPKTKFRTEKPTVPLSTVALMPPYGGCGQARRGPSRHRERSRKAIAALAVKILALAALVGGGATTSKADDKKADATGTWQWVRKSPDGQESEITASLKQEGIKLTGKVNTEAGEIDIKNGTVVDGNVSFEISIDTGGSEIHVKFTGKLQGDSIKGKA